MDNTLGRRFIVALARIAHNAQVAALTSGSIPDKYEYNYIAKTLQTVTKETLFATDPLAYVRVMNHLNATVARGLGSNTAAGTRKGMTAVKGLLDQYAKQTVRF